MTEVRNKVEYRPIASLEKWVDNPRTISKRELDLLKKSLKEDPDYFEGRPILLSDRTGVPVIIAGNQRYEAAKALGWTEVPTVLYHCKSEEEEVRRAMRDNHNNGEWDVEMLANKFTDYPLDDWLGSDWDSIADGFKPKVEIVEDDPDDIDTEETYSKVGEIYQLGSHRVYCGSFEDSDKVAELFGGEKATCTFTDPPYNVAVKNRTTGKTIQNDNMKSEDFQIFLDSAFQCVADNMKPGAGVISWMSDQELLTLRSAMDRAGMHFRTVICWVKDHFTLGGNDFQSAKELAIYGTGEGKFDRGDDETSESEYAIYARGKEGTFTNVRSLSNVWFFDKPRKSLEHPTMKPVGLCAKGILAMSGPDDIVMDLFLGSGSTLIACEQTGRKCYGCELDPKYCDVIRKRYYKFIHNGVEDGWQEGTPAV